MSESDVNRILQRLSVIETKVDEQAADAAEDRQVHKEHDQRIRYIERIMWISLGAALASGSGVAAVATHVFGN